MKQSSDLKVAIVHDWLIGGGAERVVLELHKLYPDAPIYTSYCTEEWRAKLDNKVVTGYLQKGPFPKLRKFIPILRAIWFSNLKLDNYNLVISSSGAEAKAVKTSKNTLHVNYCHSPTHYYWIRYDEYIANPGFGVFNWLARLGLKIMIGPMRRWDLKAAQRPDVMIANSSYTQTNIKKYYKRDSTIIYPPVDIERFATKSEAKREGFLTVGRQTPYMRKDLAIAACNQLKLPLTVIGKGPEHDKLVAMAGPTINFPSDISDNEIVEHFQKARAFILPGQEDFGIVGVEALAAGTPVIGYQAGGAPDYIEPGKTGVLFAEQTVESLVESLEDFTVENFSSANLKKRAADFSPAQFQVKFQKLVSQNRTKDPANE